MYGIQHRMGNFDNATTSSGWKNKYVTYIMNNLALIYI